MRLLNTKTGRFEEFVDLKHAPPYAILSHTWDKEGEQSYEDVVKIQGQFGLAAHQSSASVSPRAQTTLPTMNDASGGSASSAISITAEDRQDTIRSSWLRRIRRPISRMKDDGRSVSPDGGVSTPPYPIPSALGPSPAAKASHAVHSPRPRPPSIWDPDSELSEKVRKACEIARRDGYGYIWVDSSCINKTSSSELSEAINSMFNWYRGAQVCYAFLVDVPSDEDVKALDPHYSAADRARGFDPPKDSKFRKSRWFQRAWTLQELISPRLVVFLSQDWEHLGTKDSLADLIEEITHIDRAILTHKKALTDESVAERMRWAASRQATRVEDEAYSLLGIFGITMPTLYGEGEYAFRRLQEEILRRIPDQSLFAWGDGCEPLPTGSSEIKVYVKDSDQQSLFAPSPRSFSFQGGKIIPASWDALQSLDLPVEEYTPTPYGIRTQRLLLPLYAFNPMLTVTGELNGMETWYLVILGCQQVDDRGLGHSQTGPPERLLSRLCYITSSPQSTVEFLSVPYKYLSRYHPVFSIAQSALNGLTESCAARRRIVHLPHPKPPTPSKRTFKPVDSNEYRAGLEISLSSWTQAALRPHGYAISDFHPTKHRPDSYSLTLFNASFNIHIQYRHMVIRFRNRIQVVIEARIWTPPSSDSDEDAWSAMVQHTPPYTSATWVDETPRSMTLPQKRVRLLTPSEDEVTLQLGLSFTTPPQYNAYIEIATDSDGEGGATFGLSSRDRDLPGDPGMNAPHTDLKLTMQGSVRKALETRGYSVHLEHCPAAPHVDSSHSYALTISNASSDFTISIRYYHILRKCRRTFFQQELIVAARVVLESSPSIPNNNPSKMHHDGPYVVGWGDDYGTFPDLRYRWQWHQELKEICLATPNGRSVTLRLGLDLAWESEYYLVIDIGGDRDDGSSSGIGKGYPPCLLLNNNPHADRVSLTLPAHVKRALQTHGYDVHFKGPGEDSSDPYHLTLSDRDANLTIDIEYSYDLCTNAEILRRRLSFRACVATSPLRTGTPGGAAEVQSGTGSQIVDWDAWRPDTRDEIDGAVLEPGGWYWDLPQKDVTLALPTRTGAELTLRLGFYLVWLAEYCITVEVISPSPLPPPTTDEEAAPPPADTNRGSIDEDTGDGAGMQETVASEADDPAIAAHSALC